MNNKFILFILFFLFPLFYQAQNVKITGLAKTYENEEIGVWVYNDFISNTEKQITYSAIDSAGNFILEFNCKAIQYITLKIDKSIASLFVEPNGLYDIKIMPRDSTTYQNPNLEHDVKISINLKSKTEINALTIDYDKQFDDFLTREYGAFVTRNPQPKIDTFKVRMNHFYGDVKNNYFDAYRMYTIAALEEKTKVSKKKLYNTYLNKKPILYNNPEYFNFFNTFYKQYFKQVFSQLYKHNDQGRREYDVLEIMKKDVFLVNDTIRELVFIKGLYESYYDGSIKKENVINMLDYIQEAGTIVENQQIVQNILNSFSKLKPGALAPGFVLPDTAGITHSLDELRAKKYIYLFVFDQECTTCLQQMKIISKLKKQYGSRIEFVGVSVDKTYTDFKNFCLKNPEYKFLFLFNNSGKLFKDKYEIKSLPAYFLIDPEGKFTQVPAESPEGDIDRAFYDITKPKGKKHLIGDKTNR